MEAPANKILVIENKKTIEILYRTIYPYGTFNGDYASACIAIDRELTKLCTLERKDILAVIARAANVNINHDDNTNM